MKHLQSITETQEALGGLSRSKVEELIRTNQITAVKIGTAVRVVTASVDDYIARLIEEADRKG